MPAGAPHHRLSENSQLDFKNPSESKGNTVPMNPLAIVECIVQAAVGVAPTVHLAEIRLRRRVATLGANHWLTAVPVAVREPALH